MDQTGDEQMLCDSLHAEGMGHSLRRTSFRPADVQQEQHCNMLKNTAARFNTLHRTAAHCNTLQHTAV